MQTILLNAVRAAPGISRQDHRLFPVGAELTHRRFECGEVDRLDHIAIGALRVA